MRWSNSFLPTLRDDPADAEAISHKLLIRAGFVRQLMTGVYSVLPLGFRVVSKIAEILRDEMQKIGGQEFLLPSLQPGELWQRTGRWDGMGQEMFKFSDRRGTDVGLAVTHEEVFAQIASEMRSYKQLPQFWFQIQKKFRDELRPKSGVLRVREFTMKDSYSLDIDLEGLDKSFDRHFDAYRKIFKRLGLEAVAVEASSGSMGGSQSVEFMVKSDAGEDWIASCAACGYAANFEKATSNIPDVKGDPGPDAPEKFATPGVRTIDDLAKFDGGAPADRQIKTLVYQADGKTLLVLLRGDHVLVEQKLIDGIEASEVRPAAPEEILQALGASAGSLGAVGVTGHFVIADSALAEARNVVTGANEDGFHLRGVDIQRDIEVNGWLDLRQVNSGEGCPSCNDPLAVFKTIEVGHIFKLGTFYSEKLDATVLDQNGKARPIVMGSYGIGLERAMASIVESSHDDRGIVWPVNVAPFEVVVTVLNPKDVKTAETGEHIYEALVAAGIDVIIDDRDERPGVKFKDAELVGIPYRLTVGPKGLEKGIVEWTRRRDGERQDLPVDRAAETAIETIFQERS